jgi:hypothetical protein
LIELERGDARRRAYCFAISGLELHRVS